jgi:hypothetical protein
MIPKTNQLRRLWTPSSSSLTVSTYAPLPFAVIVAHPANPDHKDDISREQLKELLYEEIMTFTPQPIT